MPAGWRGQQGRASSGISRTVALGRDSMAANGSSGEQNVKSGNVTGGFSPVDVETALAHEADDDRGGSLLHPAERLQLHT